MSETTTTLAERVEASVAEALRRSAARRAELSPRQLAAAEALLASVPARLAVWEMGPSTGKGVQQFRTPGFGPLVFVRS